MSKEIVPNDSRIILYASDDGEIKVDVRFQGETVWLTQKLMAQLFECSVDNILLHIKNIFVEKELNLNSVTEEYSVTAADGKSYKTRFYNLDAIISVGYRVNSTRATQFRVWATKVLKSHLVDGYTINEKRLRLVEHKYLELQKSMKLLGNVISLENISGETKGFIEVISQYSRALDILDDYDNGRLTVPKGTRKLKYSLTYEEARSITDEMRKNIKGSSFFGQEKDKSFESSIRTIGYL